jgi:acetoacetate decarboxylase
MFKYKTIIRRPFQNNYNPINPKNVNLKMSFVRTFDQIMEMMERGGAEFYDAEALWVLWKTKPELIKKVLPRPLKPTKDPVVGTFIANYPKTNFGVSYNESVMGVLAQFKGEIGLYVLSMPVDDDMAMVGGREVFGYPKKMANFLFKREGDTVEGWTERKGIRFIEMKGKITGKTSQEDVLKMFNEFGIEDFNLTIYNFKYFPSPGGSDSDNFFDYNPRLVHEKVTFKHRSLETVEAEVKLTPSKFDPWAELEIVEMIGSFYTIGDNTMQIGKVVAEVKPTTFTPYAFLKYDPF